MKYQLTNKLRISRPVIFLCGPYYDSKNSHDRRNVLRETIHSVYSDAHQQVLPLIVDLFLTDDNLDTNEYSVQLLEEICASISFQTHIFLDTMSAATELGIFANSSYDNDICVYLPKKDDTYNQGLVGYFVRNCVLNKPGKKITTLEYHPSVEKKAFSSIYVAEFFGFNNNVIPKNILDLIKEKAADNKNFLETDISYVDTSKNDYKDYNTIGYSIVDDKLLISLSLKYLFYIATSIIIQENKHVCQDLAKADIDEIIGIVKEAIKNSTCFELGYSCDVFSDVSIETDIKVDVDILIKHIIKFVNIYYLKSQFKAYSLVMHPSKIAEPIKNLNNPISLFQMDREDCDLLKDINANPDSYFEEFMLEKGFKIRSIVKYADSWDGFCAKKFHKKIDKVFKSLYIHDEHSYAYHDGLNIIKCVNKHIDSIDFMKFDISNFFGSISIDLLAEKMGRDFEIEECYISQLYKILSGCFYEGKMPIGLAFSPTLSDYYMQDFDKEIGEYCDNNKLIYTRYADDIMISSSSKMDSSMVAEINNKINELFKRLDLSSNDSKNLHVTLGENRNSIKYIGISIVKSQKGNYLSVGKKYIRLVAKEFKEYKKLKLVNELDSELEEKLFYLRMKLIGKIDFIKQVEGPRGLERIKACLQNDYPDEDFTAI